MWKNLVKKALLCGVCAGSLLWPYEADAARRQYDNKRTKRTERISRRDRTTPSYPTPKTPEVPPEHKLAHFKQQILKTPNAELSPKDKTWFIQLLDILSSVPRGRWIIENAPSDLKFRIYNQQGHSGVYNRKTVSIKRHGDPQEEALSLAHEMTHAIQHHRGMSRIPLHDLQEVLIVNRLKELHAVVEQARIDHQLSRPKKGSRYDWAIELAEEKEKQGLSPQAANRFARTEMVKRFWQNHASTSIQINGKEIRVSRRIDHWNRSYDLYYFKKDFVDNNASKKNFDRILRMYIQAMEVDIQPEFFISPETSAFRLEKNKLTTYLNGIRRQEIHILDEGKLEKEYKNGELLYIRLHPQESSKTKGNKTFSFTGGRASYSVRNGEINGIYREYDAQGKQVLEVPMEEGHSEGDGWQIKENGEKKVIRFRFKEVFPYYRSKQRN